MKLTVYIDILVAVNIIINYLLIKITSVITGNFARTDRSILSAIMGALFSLIIFIDINFVFSFVLKIISIVFSVLIAFGYRDKYQFIKNILIFLFINTAFTGIVILLAKNISIIYVNNLFYYFSLNPVLLVVCIFTMYMRINVWELMFSVSKEQLYNITIEINGETHNRTAYYDTGFKLKDIIAHRILIICSFEYIRTMISKELADDINLFFHTGEYRNSAIIPVFYSDISSKGMLPSIKTDRVIIKGKEKNTEVKNVSIAVCRQPLPAAYQVLLGKELAEKIGAKL